MDNIDTIAKAPTEGDVKAALLIAQNFLALGSSTFGQDFKGRIQAQMDDFKDKVLHDDRLDMGDRECLRNRYLALKGILDTAQEEFDAAIRLLHIKGELPGYMSAYVKPEPPAPERVINREEMQPFSSTFFSPDPTPQPPTK